MSDWWEQPYPGGPMVNVAGFPRPLYAPGNPSKKPPSPDGPDVVAYKRAVARLGRWPWDPTGYDDTYSKNFALGKTGGNVGDSGVRGCQRQQPELDDTGQLGEKTFNFLRAARIPEGLPNAGQPAFDTNCLNLIAEAYNMFQPTGGLMEPTIRLDALDEARTQLGYVEGPNNDTKYGSWYGANFQPWCAMFVTWCYIGAGSSCFLKGSRYAYCPYVYADAQAGRYGLSLTTSPMAGDLVLYDWDGSDYDHIGIYEDGTKDAWNAIEGNTSPDNAGSQSNGGGVYRRARTRSSLAKVAFVRATG